MNDAFALEVWIELCTHHYPKDQKGQKKLSHRSKYWVIFRNMLTIFTNQRLRDVKESPSQGAAAAALAPTRRDGGDGKIFGDSQQDGEALCQHNWQGSSSYRH